MPRRVAEDKPENRSLTSLGGYPDERARKRKKLLKATEKKLDAVVKTVSHQKRPLRGKDKIGLRVGCDLKNTKTKKHFELTIQG